MQIHTILTCALALGLSAGALAQDAPAAPSGQQQGGRGYGRGMGMGFGGRGVMGTVTEVAPDHFTVKNDSGEIWTVHYDANTHIMKQAPRPANAAAGGQAGTGGQAGAGGQADGQGEGRMFRGTPPTPIKASDIKVGDAIAAAGEMDQGAKSVGAVMVMQLDPESAKRMEEMRANFGKTWLSGRVTAINDASVTVEGTVDRQPHTFVADENTDFRQRRDPITLADIKAGDMVRVEGSVKSGQFVASSVNLMAPQANGGPARRPGPPPQ